MHAFRVHIATAAVVALTPALAVAAAAPAQATRLANCNVNGGVAPCFEELMFRGTLLPSDFVTDVTDSGRIRAVVRALR